MNKEKIKLSIEVEAHTSSEFSSVDLTKRIIDCIEERLCNPQREDPGAIRIVPIQSPFSPL